MDYGILIDINKICYMAFEFAFFYGPTWMPTLKLINQHLLQSTFITINKKHSLHIDIKLRHRD